MHRPSSNPYSSPKYLSSSFKLNPNLHKHTNTSISNKENTHYHENIVPSENPEILLENLFKRLNYFSNSSKNFLKSAEKLSKHVIKEPIAEKNLQNYANERRKMENSLDIIVNSYINHYL